jgi:hypothetical protein
MRSLLALAFCGVALAAQQTQLATPAEKQEFNRMLDELRAAIRADDWVEASRISVRLNAEMLARRSRTLASPLLELQHLQQLGGANPITRNPLLARMAKAAFAAGEWDRATGYAKEALEAATHGVFPWTGDAIHQGNIVLGRLALRRSDIDGAKRYLLAAGKAPGSSQLASLGPNMALARDLLDRSEQETVLTYLEECSHFWDGNRGKLAEWTALVKAGLKPDFGRNLEY